MWNNILYTGYAKRNICYIELCVIISVVYLDVNLITILKKMYHLHQLQYKNNA